MAYLPQSPTVIQTTATQCAHNNSIPRDDSSSKWQTVLPAKTLTIPAKTRVGLLGLKQQHCGWDWLTRILH